MDEREQSQRRAIEHLWAAFDRFEFEAAGAVLHDDFVCEWPQSGERIRGRDNYVALNAHYPGRWRIAVQRLFVCGDQVISQVRLEFDGKVDYCTSFFEFRDGRIVKETDFWSETYPAPEWRARWIERLG